MKKEISKKAVPGILRFVNIPYFNIQKGNKKKDYASYFEIYKYKFLIFEKWNKQKNCAISFKICKYTFLTFEKGTQHTSCDRYF